MQRGEAGDITAGLTLGIWTDALAQKLMANHEQNWEQAGVPVSVALGELTDWLGPHSPVPPEGAWQGISFRKLGLAGVRSSPAPAQSMPAVTR